MVHWLLKCSLVGLANLYFLFVAVSPSLAEERTNGKTLILYYSLTGNTRTSCEVLQERWGRI